MKHKMIISYLKIALMKLLYSLVLSIVASVIIGVLCWLTGWWTLFQFAVALQYGSIVILILGSMSVLAQSPIGPRYREIAKFMPLTHTARNKSVYNLLMKERSSSISILTIIVLSMLMLYGISTLIFRIIL